MKTANNVLGLLFTWYYFSGTQILVQYSILWAKQQSGGGLSCSNTLCHCRRLHRPKQQLGKVLLRFAVQCQQKFHNWKYQKTYWKGGTLVLRWWWSLCWMPVRLGHLCPVAQLQSPPRLPSIHCLQNSSWLFTEDIQQSGICSTVVPECEPWIWSRLWSYKDVYNQNVLRQGLGCRVSSSGCHKYSLLDRDSSSRTITVAGQGAHTDGCTSWPYFLRLLNLSRSDLFSQ